MSCSAWRSSLILLFALACNRARDETNPTSNSRTRGRRPWMPEGPEKSLLSPEALLFFQTPRAAQRPRESPPPAQHAR